MSAPVDWPKPVFWEATTGCNLACRHCRRADAATALSRWDLSTDQAKRHLIAQSRLLQQFRHAPTPTRLVWGRGAKFSAMTKGCLAEEPCCAYTPARQAVLQ